MGIVTQSQPEILGVGGKSSSGKKKIKNHKKTKCALPFVILNLALLREKGCVIM